MALAFFLLVACKKENTTVPLHLYLTDNPVELDEVNVEIKSVQVKMGQDTTSWLSLDTRDSIYNLLDLQNDSTLLAFDEVPAGVLKEVRFILGARNSVVANGTVYPLATPSAQHSGLKVKVNKALNAQLNSFVLDFDAALSVHEENGAYKLLPVIRLKG